MALIIQSNEEENEQMNEYEIKESLFGGMDTLQRRYSNRKAALPGTLTTILLCYLGT